MSVLPKLYLRRGKEDALQRRHPWVFSGAVDSVECDGELVEGALELNIVFYFTL